MACVRYIFTRVGLPVDVIEEVPDHGYDMPRIWKVIRDHGSNIEKLKASDYGVSMPDHHTRVRFIMEAMAPGTYMLRCILRFDPADPAPRGEHCHVALLTKSERGTVRNRVQYYDCDRQSGMAFSKALATIISEVQAVYRIDISA